AASDLHIYMSVLLGGGPGTRVSEYRCPWRSRGGRRVHADDCRRAPPCPALPRLPALRVSHETDGALCVLGAQPLHGVSSWHSWPRVRCSRTMIGRSIEPGRSR